MTGYEFCDGGYWWIFPLVMMVLCFFFMRGCSCRSDQGSYGLGPWRSPRESPLDLLRKRYAKGEIDQQEYEERKKTLKQELLKPQP